MERSKLVPGYTALFLAFHFSRCQDYLARESPRSQVEEGQKYMTSSTGQFSAHVFERNDS